MELNGGDTKQEQTVIDLDFGQFCYMNHSLSSPEMESLSAISDTLLPSLDVSDHHHSAIFHQTSASMLGTPERVAELMRKAKRHPKHWMLRVALWLLSTHIGTLVLCGRFCISCKFPFFERFSKLPQHKREQILLSWSLSYFSLLRILFRTLKLLTLYAYFSQVNEKNENPSWTAIGYKGPDPEFKSSSKIQSKTSKQNGSIYPISLIDQKQEHKEQADEEHLFGPLYRGLINLKHPREVVSDNLRRLGFPVTQFLLKIDKFKPSLSNPSMKIQCDAVVVGSGSGGGVVAGVLAKAGYRVVVLEKGEYFARTNLTLLEGPTMDQMYLSGGMLVTDDLGVVILAGSTVGGGSTINWSASIKTPEHVINEWADVYDLQLFDSMLYREAMDVVCRKMGVQCEIDEEGFNNAILRKGCQELGYPVNNIPRNSSPDHYCGWCCLGCKDGRKKGTAETWLVDLVNSGKGAIFPGCQAVKVLHKKKKGKDRKIATGVAFEFEYKGAKDICIVESKITIVACGAMCTPVLLKKSGLKNPNIGKNLHLHPVAMAWGYFPDEPGWPEREKTSYEGGIMTAMSTVVGNFEKSGYGAVIQTPALHPGMFSSLMPWISGKDMKNRMCKFSRTAHMLVLARDKGSGTVKSKDAISYEMEEIDEENLKKGIEKVLRILAAAGAEEIGTHHNKGKVLNVKKVSSNEFERFVKEESSRALRDLSTPICSAHQMGSCKMGIDPKESVVNQMGETWEVEGLFLADSSVFPGALGVNPMVTIQAIAYCTAQSALETLKRKKRSP